MKIVVEKNQLLDGLSKINAVISGSKITSSEIYNCVLIETIDNTVRMTGTDGDVTLMVAVSANVETEGKVAVPVKRINDIVRKFNDSEVVISGKEDYITLQCGRGNYRLTGYNAELFPKRPDTVTEFDFEIEGKVLNHVSEKVAFAVADDDPRPAFNGIYWKIDDKGLTMAATDTHKLASIKYSDDSASGLAKNLEAIVPPKALKMIGKIESKEETKFKIKIEDNHISFCLENNYLYSKLIRGPYPDFTKVVPNNNDIMIKVNVQEFLAAAERVSIVSHALTHMVKFKFTEGVLLLMGVNTEIGEEGTEEVMIDYQGETIEMGFNGEYVQTILKLIDSENVMIKLSALGGAGLIEPEETNDNEEYLYVIMPLKFTEY